MVFYPLCLQMGDIDAAVLREGKAGYKLFLFYSWRFQMEDTDATLRDRKGGYKKL